MTTKTIEIPCDGYSIVADWYEGKNQDEILLVLPGYSSSRARQRDLTEAILKETGTSALAIDYSGHGDSPFELGDTRPAQHFLELVNVFDQLKKQHPKAKVTILGTSYGGFLATQLTKYREFEKLVLRVPAIYKPEAFYDLWAIRLDNADKYDKMIQAYRNDAVALAKHPLFARAASFKGKTLVVVHDEDELVPKPTTDAFIKTFNAESFVEPYFTHSVASVANETRVSSQQLHGYRMKIAKWLKEN